MSGCAAGSYGATSGARIPTSTMTPSTNRATRDDGLRSMLRTPTPSGDSRGRATLVATDSWIGPGIKQIGEEAAKRDHDAADDYSAHNERIITGADGADHRQPHPRPRKDLLDEKSAGEKRGERKADQADDRKEGVTQRVTPQNLALGEPFEPRGTYVVGGKNVEQRRSLISRHDRGREDRESERRQKEVAQAINGPAPPAHVFMHYGISRSTNRENRQPVSQREQGEYGQPEVRHGEKEQRHAAQHVIRCGASPRHLNQCDEDAEAEAADQRDYQEKKRVGQ